MLNYLQTSRLYWESIMNYVSDKAKPYALRPLAEPIAEPARYVRLFRNGANQAVRIPKEFEFSANEAVMRKVGNTLVIEPVPPRLPERGSPAAMLLALEEIRKLGPCEDEFPNVDDGLLPLDDIVL
jgi:antitoxin VapB